MQGGQIPSNNTVGMDYVQQRASEERAAARGAREVRRHRPRHRQRFSWLHLGRHHQHHAGTAHSHAAPTAPPELSASGAGVNAGGGTGPDRQREY
jgi:hypothetical protein